MKSFHYVTLSDMMTSIRKNLYKIPHDLCGVIGIPRSGMIVASVVSELINVPLTDLESFIKDQSLNGGHRLELFKSKDSRKILVCDDTIYSGRAMKEAKAKLSKFESEYDFIYCAAYLEGFSSQEVDFFLEDVSSYSRQDIQVIYEWNIFHHYPHIMSRCVFDVDGVFCIEDGRPDDSLEEEYENYIKNATPYIIPKVRVGAICTYRINKYLDITTDWLIKNGIYYDKICMFNADSWRDRNYSGVSPENFKANFYRKHPEYLLFIESNDREARRIHEITGKQVLCTDTNILYG